MKISRNRSLKTCLAAAGAAAVFVTTLPATASADVVDSALNQIPSGQISCEAAESYWTTESEYESYRSQAAAVAAFHPRGGEINDALARIEEAANRCGLKGGGAPVAEQAAPVAEQATPVASDDQAAAPAPADNQQATTQNTPDTTPEGKAAEGEAPTAPAEQAPEETTPGTATDVEQIIADLQEGNPLAQLALTSSQPAQ